MIAEDQLPRAGDNGMLCASKMYGFYGPIAAVRNVSFTVRSGECLGIVGSNGAGKTSLLKAVVGLISASGEVFLDGKRFKARTATRRRSGLVLVPQERVAIAGLTIEENLRLTWLTGRRNSSYVAGLDRVLALFPTLAGRLKDYAGALSGGQRQMLAVGRGLMSDPLVLLLDEPTAGLAPIIVEELSSALKSLSQAGLAMVLVEQNINVARAVADRVLVINGGSAVWEGLPRDLDAGRAADLYFGASGGGNPRADA